MLSLKDNIFWKHTQGLLIGILCVFFFSAKSQCFQIESILVDGCDGNDEGKNEMVIFKVGATALNVNNLTVSWANNTNPWLGICQNAITTQKITQINFTILGCGYLKEPTGGILPANSKVLLVTSTDFNPLAHSFANLTDTLITIFQCAGNTAGHFANFGTGNRTLTMNFSSPTGCSDAVTYNRALLTTQAGVVGSADGATVLFTPAGASTYINYGCQAPFTPLLVDAGTDKTICNNNTLNLTATASGAYNSVLWSLGSGATGSFAPTNSLSTIYTSGINDNGSIKLYFSAIKSCGTQSTTVKDSVNVTITQAPQPVISATTNSLCTGQSAILSYSISNSSFTGTTSATWQPGSVTTPTLSVNSSGNYSLIVSNGCGSVSSSYSISSFPTPTVSITANGPTQTCSGGNIILTAQSNINNYLWNTGATTQTVNVNNTATMVVTCSNVCGSAQASQTISISPSSINASINSNSITCFGLTNGSASLTVNGGTAPYSYNWLPGGISYANINNLSAGDYSVTVTDVNNCSVTKTVNISQPTDMIANVTNTAATCSGNNGSALATVNGGTSPYTYSWTPGNQNNASITNLSNGSYTVTITDNNGCVKTAITTLVGNNTINAVINTTNVSCFNGSNGKAEATVNSNNPPFTFNWQTSAATTSSVNNLTAGVYTVSITDASLCKTIKSFTITQPNQLIVNVNSAKACPNQTITLTANASGGTGTYTYNWDNGLSLDQSYVLTPSITKTYSVEVTDQNGCKANDTALVTVTNNLSIDFTSNKQDGCPTLCIDFSNLNTSTSIESWLWNFGDGQTATTPSVNHCYTSAGNYTVSLTATSLDGCTKTTTKDNYIHVFDKPIANFEASSYDVDLSNSEIQLTDLSSNTTSILWNFPDANSSTLSNTTYTFEKEGTYIISLYALNNTCVDSIKKEITVKTDFTFYAPNSFTPNDNFKNDVFIPLGTYWDEKEYRFTIFDRWGHEVFSTTDINKGWDGKLKNGQAAEDNIYVWKVELYDLFKHYHEFVGHVSLIR